MRGSGECRSWGPIAASVRIVMLSMFVLWAIVFVGVFRRQRWVPVLALVTLVWTIIALKLHMTSAIPLNF